MKLARHVTNMVGFVMLAMALVLIVGAGAALLRSADQADKKRSVEEVQRVRSAIADETDTLEGNAVDWSMWDETYAFMKRENPDYLAVNLPRDTFSNLGVNLIGLYDPSGAVRVVESVDLESLEATTFAGVDDLLRDHPELNLSTTHSAPTSGVYPLADGRVLMLGAGPVLPTDQRGEALGTLVMGRVLDQQVISSIAERTGLALSLDPKPASGSSSSTTVTASGDVIRLSAPLAASDGSVLASIGVERPRQAWSDTVASLKYLALAVLALVGITTRAIHFGVKRSALDRLKSLEDAVARIRSTGQPESLALPGNDELTELANNVEDLVFELGSAKSSAEQALEAKTASEERYASLLENLSDVVFSMDAEGTLEFVSAAAFQMLGVVPDSVVGADISTLLGSTAADRVLRRVRRGLSAGGSHLTVESSALDGTPIDLDIILTPLPDGRGIQGILRDVTARRRHENELLHMASHDFLTGLWNRRRFEDELARELAEAAAGKTAGGVLWLDLDGFKDVNDTLGHKAGDELLVEISRRLSASVRSDSVVARLGGDEFAIMLRGCEREEAIAGASRISKDISRMRFEIDGQVVRASTSLGIVLYPEHGTEVEDLLARADMAMYQAKELGRSRAVVFDPREEWRNGVEDRRVWTEMVELALSQDGLVAHAQPISDMQTGRVVSYELLVRMLDFGGSLIPPDRFLPVAERTGMIVDIDIWILGKAIAILADSADAAFRVNVNVSPRTLSDPRFLDELTRLVTTSPVDPSRLSIEITETAIIVDVASVSDTLRKIKSLGCRITLDDFGSGFTSFLHLKQLPVDDIKIDGSFVRNVSESRDDQHLVRAMVEMARGMKMQTTAEFVESQGSLDMLRTFGVEMAQGYLIGRPGPIDEVIRSNRDREKALHS